jgi:3-hydroxyisobutyrate dehydrogenase-like beta-hydroxyacid dehydrogenase
MSAAPIRRVGFVGIGSMGWPMAARLVQAGFEVTAADAAPGRAAAFAAEVGGRAAGSVADAARGHALVTMLVKDLSIALEIGRDAGTPTPFAALCRELWASAASLLGPGQDHTAAARLSEQLAGAELGRTEPGRTRPGEAAPGEAG